MTIAERLTKLHPRLPVLLANTMASKVIQIIKNRIIDPALADPRRVQRIQSWSPKTKLTAEWFMYVLSGAVRTMSKSAHPVRRILQEALAESLTQVGIKITEISSADQFEIIDATMPLLQDRFFVHARTDSQLRDRLDSIFGSAYDWAKIFGSAEQLLSDVNQKTKDHRQSRKARGWRRFLW